MNKFIDLQNNQIREPVEFDVALSDVLESELTPTPRACFSSSSRLFISPLLSLIRGECVYYSGRWLSGSVFVNIPINEDPFFFDGHEIGREDGNLDIVISMPGEEHDYSFKNKYGGLGLYLDPGLLNPILEKLVAQDEHFRFENLMRFKSHEHKARFLDLVLPLFQSGLGETEMSAEESQILSLKIVAQFLLSIEYERDMFHERSYCRCIAVQAHHLIIDSPHQVLSMNEISSALSACSRSIQQGFNEVYGRGVIKYHKSWRMALVRKHLQQNGAKDIGNVIKQYGFKHVGRFARAYRDTFGLNPSEEEYRMVNHSLCDF